MGIVPDNNLINSTMNKLSLIASALAVLGLTACEKGLVEDGIEDVGSGQSSDGTFRLTADPDWDSVNGYTF